MPRTPLVALVTLAALAGCGPKSSTHGPGGGGKMPPAVATYAGLRWVPDDVTYALVTHRVDDGVAVAHDLLEAIGIAGDFDVAEVERDMSHDLAGLDPLSTKSLADNGVDLARGVAVFSRGVSPTFAVPLADPQRFAAFIEERRAGGAVVQVSRVHDVDVYTYRPSHDTAFHWAIAGDWVLAHFEIKDEHEADGAWFEAAWAAHGGLAGGADFAAAIDQGKRRLGGTGDPPVVGLARAPALLALPLLSDAACEASFAAVGRVFAAAGVDHGDARGAIVAELASTGGVRALGLPAPGGWTKARAGAPLDLELGFDIRAAAESMHACLREDLAADVGAPVRGGRLFLFELDLDGRKARGAVVGDMTDMDAVHQMLDEVPLLSRLQRARTVSGLPVFDVDVPMVPSFSYALLDQTVVAAAGGGGIDAVLAGGMVAAGDELARVEAHPQALDAAGWDHLLAPVIERDGARERLVKRMRRWSLGEITLTVDGNDLVLGAHGQR